MDPSILVLDLSIQKILKENIAGAISHLKVKGFLWQSKAAFEFSIWTEAITGEPSQGPVCFTGRERKLKWGKNWNKSKRIAHATCASAS